MGKKKQSAKPERFSASKYFEDDYKYLPFKDVKLKPAEPKKEAPKKARPLTSRDYDMYIPGSENVVQKTESLPIGLLRECSPQASCDLHGKKPGRDDIAALVNEFLDQAVSKGLKKVEIIVGRGNHSDGEPVIPGIVEAALGNSRVVREYECAPANKGGKGSFWIILGKREAKSVNVYATRPQNGQDIKGLKDINLRKPKKIDYDSYLPDENDKRSKM